MRMTLPRLAPPRAWFAAVLLLPLMAALPARAAVSFPPARAADVNFAGGSFADTTFEDVTYVTSDFMAQLLGATPRWDPAAQQLRLRDAAGREWIFTLDNPFISVQGRTYNLTYPVRRGPERIYLPMYPLLRVLQVRLRLDLSPGAAVPAVAAAGPAAGNAPPGTITAMTLEETPEGSVLRLRAPGGLDGTGIQWQGVLARPHYIVRGFGGVVDPSVPRRLDGAGPLQSVEARQQGNTAQFTLRLRGSRDTVEMAREDSGWRLTVRTPSSEDGKRPTIIIDAGHGGKDPGAIVAGVRESDVNLAVAKLLRKELEARGYRVLLTRETDVYLTLSERPRFASDSGGDLFISLHCNSISGTASRLASVSGFVGYILREAESEEDKAIARRENQAAEEQSGKKKTEISPLDWILLEHQLNLYSKQSEALAEAVVRSFAGFQIPRYSTGARQAGFFVLVGAYMPAMLFEMGFLTHPGDRKVLASPSGQREIARRLAVAIDGFQKGRK